MIRLTLMTAFIGILTWGWQASAAENPTRSKLNAAKAEYDKAMKDYKDEVGRWFDKEDESARKAAANVTERVKAIMAEKKDFEESGTLPKRAPSAFKDKPAKAITGLTKAYKTASDEFTRQKNDEEAMIVQKELAEFVKSNPEWRVKFPVGKYSCVYNTGVKASTELRADGTYIRVKLDNPTPSEGKFAFEKGTLIFRNNTNDPFEVWTIVGDEIRLKHWYPTNTYPAGPPTETGKAIRQSK
ncbi:hypothetical protein [Zavarzinella formosa]|uniref:hypothetical protein n=1 Tax=Zavarzinella formosa TaxID=360055 RepID=UPI0012FAA2D9|nr:hypothetical protein [Zavarzinella formosa]